MTTETTQRDHGATVHFDGVLMRARALIDEESAALHEGLALDCAAMVARKNMIAFELNKMASDFGMVDIEPGVKRQLGELKASLAANQKLLQVHISAAREVAQTLAEFVRIAESDGTYTVDRTTWTRHR
jgi:predicted alpha/beta-fold hydrolase